MFESKFFVSEDLAIITKIEKNGECSATVRLKTSSLIFLLDLGERNLVGS